jgi:hypothetical protein
VIARRPVGGGGIDHVCPGSRGARARGRWRVGRLCGQEQRAVRSLPRDTEEAEAVVAIHAACPRRLAARLARVRPAVRLRVTTTDSSDRRAHRTVGIGGGVQRDPSLVVPVGDSLCSRLRRLPYPHGIDVSV